MVLNKVVDVEERAGATGGSPWGVDRVGWRPEGGIESDEIHPSPGSAGDMITGAAEVVQATAMTLSPCQREGQAKNKRAVAK